MQQGSTKSPFLVTAVVDETIRLARKGYGLSGSAKEML